LDLYGADRVQCFVSEKIPYGTDWYDQIRENLSRADVIVLLFTLTDASWDWPLYEVGLATDPSDTDTCKVVCIYPPYSKPPDPIKYSQAVKADQDSLSDFLFKFFCTGEITGCDPPLNPRFEEDKTELIEVARKLSARLAGAEPWSHCFTNFFWITVDTVPLESEEIPRDAKILAESSAFDLFRLTPKPPGRDNWTWGELLEKVSASKDDQWVSDLAERFYWASRGEVLRTMKTKLTCMKTGRTYRPLLHRVDLKPNGSMQFEVIFVVHEPHRELEEDSAEPATEAGG
jgi:hypothetical protein